jgi:hypothetical protein
MQLTPRHSDPPHYNLLFEGSVRWAPSLSVKKAHSVAGIVSTCWEGMAVEHPDQRKAQRTFLNFTLAIF